MGLVYTDFLSRAFKNQPQMYTSSKNPSCAEWREIITTAVYLYLHHFPWWFKFPYLILPWNKTAMLTESHLKEDLGCYPCSSTIGLTSFWHTNGSCKFDALADTNSWDKGLPSKSEHQLGSKLSTEELSYYSHHCINSLLGCSEYGLLLSTICMSDSCH